MNKKLVNTRFMIVGFLFLALIGSVRVQPSDASDPDTFETRCGWFSNPTPGNATLYDRDGEWIIGTQGGHQAEGDWPEFKSGQWVKTNGNYGHGCACIRLRVNRETHEVIEIESSRVKPLTACRRDRSLKKWDFK
jgi:hypothetical protein